MLLLLTIGFNGNLDANSPFWLKNDKKEKISNIQDLKS